MHQPNAHGCCDPYRDERPPMQDMLLWAWICRGYSLRSQVPCDEELLKKMAILSNCDQS